MSLISSLIPSFTSRLSNRDAQVAAPAPDEPTISPRHEVSESPEAYTLVVELPGVTKAGLDVSADHEQVRVFGRRAWRKPEGWDTLHRESNDEAFELVLDHGRTINPDQVSAEFKDGVLRVTLPKAEALKPRKISVA